MAVGNRPASHHFYQVMNTIGLSEQELVNDVLAVATLATVELSHSVYHISLSNVRSVPLTRS
jgi:hypothetical protein